MGDGYERDRERKGGEIAFERSQRPLPFLDLREGQRLKKLGMEIAAGNRQPLLQYARQQAIRIGAERGECTADDVQAALRERFEGYRPRMLGNAAGSIFRGGPWIFRGRFCPSHRPSRHGNLIRIWEFVGKTLAEVFADEGREA